MILGYLMGISLIISLFIDGDTSGLQSLGSIGSWPLSITFLSRSQRLKDSFGAWIPATDKTIHYKILKCRGRAVKSTEFKLWCFWSAECGFESPAVTLVSLSKTLNHCLVLRMGRKAVGPMCCVTLVKEPSALIEKRRGSLRCSWLWLLYAP